MANIIEAIIGNVAGGIILAIIGIGGSATVIVLPKTHNPRKKWRILMLCAFVGAVITGTMTTTYSGGLAHYSNIGIAFNWIWGFFFFWGLAGNWINK